VPVDEFDIFRDDDQEENPTDGEKSAILVIDDDASIRESLETTLKDTFETILCSSGEAGIQAVTSGVDAVILDIKMEGKDGFETFREIREKHFYIPIIYHSAYQDLKSPYEIMNEFRPFGFISKGQGFAELVSLLNSAVSYHRKIVENQSLLSELKVLNASLEEKIAQRTLEIANKNEQLEETNEVLKKEIAERVKMEKALQEAERIKTLIETAGAAAHEINTPLQMVIGACELMLLKMDSAEPFRDRVEDIKKSGVKIGEIVKKMQNIRQYVTKHYVGERNIIDFDASSQEDGSRRGTE